MQQREFMTRNIYNMKRFILVIFISIIAQFSAYAQKTKDLADKEFLNAHYANAAMYYNQVLAKDASNNEVMANLAECYTKLNMNVSAEKLYEKLCSNENSSGKLLLAYAQVLTKNKKYADAKKYYEKYNDVNSADSRGASFSKALSNTQEFKKDSSNFKVGITSINSNQSDFSPSYYQKGLLFVSGREKPKMLKRVFSNDNTGYLNLYEANDTSLIKSEVLEDNGKVKQTYNPKIEKVNDNHTPTTSNDSKTLGYYGGTYLDSMVFIASISSTEVTKLKSLNTKYHEGPVAFSPKQDTIYFTRDNVIKGKAKKSADGTIKLSIFSATQKDGKWANESSFEHNSKEYSNGSPAITPDGKTMYFASDMPGGLGGSDIYMSKKSGNTWSKPVNLGKNVNSEGTENFPFVDKEGNLFFASNGKAGLGGLDIFYTQINENHDAEVRNLGAPVNSNYDDFGLIFNNDQKKGYFSSNRKRGLNDDDIYAFNYTSKGVIVLNGKILAEEDKNPLDSTAIVVKGGDVDMTQTSLADGSFSLKLEKEKEYTINYKRNGFDEKSISYSTKGKKIPTFGNLVLDTIVYSPKTKIDSAQLKKIKCDEYRRVFYLDNIYFDLGKSLIKSNAKPILDSAIKMLKNNPDVNLILSGHNNTIKNNKYSEALAKSRALAAYTYLIKNGIDKSRLNTEHHTSTVLLSTCGTGKKCPESEKQKDRRVEFMVVKSGINITLDCNLLPFTPAPLNPDEAKIANDIENIYYNTNQSTIREDAKQPLINLVQIMKQTPALNVLISGHADSRGSSAGNQNLSVKRAKAAMAFLIKNGIEKSRIQVEGFGEDKLVNKCIDGVECSPAEHQKNRRAEFYFRK